MYTHIYIDNVVTNYGMYVSNVGKVCK